MANTSVLSNMLQLVGPKKANDGRQAKETFAKFTREHEGEKFAGWEGDPVPAQ